MPEHQRRFLVDPPRGSGWDQRHFDIEEHAEEYANRCPAHTRIVDRNPPNPKQRYGDLKVPLGLIPSSAKVYAGLALAEGAKKYGAFNWRDKAVEAMTYIHAAERHLAAWVDGEELDPDSGAPHLGHALACLSILADATEVGNLIDNRPLPAPTGELLREWAVETPPGAAEDFLFFNEVEFGPMTPEEADKLQAWLNDDGEWPFRDHRTMAQVIEDERQLDDETLTTTFGPIADYLGDAHPAFGEGDETSYEVPADAWPYPQDTAPHIHRWVSFGHELVCMTCDARTPIVDQKPGQYALDDVKKHPCVCRDMDRCRIDNGHPIGNNVFCCKGEAGR